MLTNLRWGAVPLILLLFGVSPGFSACLQPPSGPRTTIIISDTHFGVGRTADNTWHPTEDFRWSVEFGQFLSRIGERGKGRTDLVLNGDTFELWQPLVDRCSVGRDKDQSCTEAEAIERIEVVLKEHPKELDDLRTFANAGENRLYIVPGNHDAALLFPGVALKAIERIGARLGRACVMEEGYWLSGDRSIYAEHGHQIGEDVNGYGEQWPRPFSGTNPRYLIRTWGEALVRDYYHEWEKKYPALDNIDSEAASARYGMAAEGLAGTALASAKFVRFLLLNESWPQFTGALGATGEAGWNLCEVRKQGSGFLTSALLAGGGLEKLEGVSVGLDIEELSDRDLRALCDRLALEDGVRHESLGAAATPIALCPRSTLSAAGQAFFGSRDKVFSRHLTKVRDDLVKADRLEAKAPFEVFIYSHTHRAERAFRPVKGDWSPAVLNTGAWQRLISEVAMEAKRKADTLSSADVLKTYSVGSLAPCYTFVAVEPSNGTARAADLMSFRLDAQSGRWIVRSAPCN